MPDQQLAADYARRIAERCDEIMDAIDNDTEMEDMPPEEWLQEWPLEIAGEFDDRAWAVVVTAGGPHCEIDNCGRVRVWWGGYAETHSDGSVRIADYFHSMTDELRRSHLGWTP